MAISSMSGAKPYLYFLDGANTDVTFKAEDLLWMEKDGAAALNLYFRSPKFNSVLLTNDSDVTDAQAYQTRANCKIVLAVATGLGKQVMKSIIAALNSPVSVGDPNARFDRGFITVADDVNSSYVDAGITAVTSITFDAKATDAIA
tara:strand:- start:137 stop:574 length:438 start_codon:yes stop_codon:yes gene_type:complete